VLETSTDDEDPFWDFGPQGLRIFFRPSRTVSWKNSEKIEGLGHQPFTGSYEARKKFEFTPTERQGRHMLTWSLGMFANQWHSMGREHRL